MLMLRDPRMRKRTFSCRGTLAVVSLFSNSYNNLTRLLEAYWRPKYPAGSRAGIRTPPQKRNTMETAWQRHQRLVSDYVKYYRHVRLRNAAYEHRPDESLPSRPSRSSRPAWRTNTFPPLQDTALILSRPAGYAGLTLDDGKLEELTLV